MEFVEKEDFETFKLNNQKLIKAKANKIHVALAETLSADKTMKRYERKVHFLDPNGANRNVWLQHTNTLDGNPWLRAVVCQNCGCGGGHMTTEEFPADMYYFINNLADAAENLVLKYTVRNHTTQTVSCNGGTHDIPVYVDSNEYVAMTINQSKGGVVFCNGLIWHGFLGVKT